jgi:hypothetical protein
VDAVASLIRPGPEDLADAEWPWGTAAEPTAYLIRAGSGHIRALPLTPIRSALVRLDPGEKLFLVSRAHFLFREKRYPRLRLFAFGRALLTDRRLLFKGKAGIRLEAPLAELDSLSVEPGDKLHFVFRGRLYRIPFRRESPLKWMDALQTLRAPAATPRVPVSITAG